jgi:hypothetical protein
MTRLSILHTEFAEEIILNTTPLQDYHLSYSAHSSTDKFPVSENETSSDNQNKCFSELLNTPKTDNTNPRKK